MDKIKIYRDGEGRLKVRFSNERLEYLIRPVSYFPLLSPRTHVGLFRLDSNGEIKEELFTVSDSKQLDPDSRSILEEELENYYEPTQITKVYFIRLVAALALWRVDTSCGQIDFETQNRQDAYMTDAGIVIIRDCKGRKFTIDLERIDKRSRILVEAYI